MAFISYCTWQLETCGVIAAGHSHTDIVWHNKEQGQFRCTLYFSYGIWSVLKLKFLFSLDCLERHDV